MQICFLKHINLKKTLKTEWNIENEAIIICPEAHILHSQITANIILLNSSDLDTFSGFCTRATFSIFDQPIKQSISHLLIINTHL